MVNRQAKRRGFVGRVADGRVANRFESVHVVEDLDHPEHDTDQDNVRRVVPTQLLPDQSRTLIRTNDSLRCLPRDTAWLGRCPPWIAASFVDPRPPVGSCGCSSVFRRIT